MEEKTLLITGANRGFGKAMVDMFANQYKVIGTVRIATENNNQAVTYIEGVDFNHEDTLKNLLPILSSCDVLINNVGIANTGLLATQSTQEIKEVLQINLISTILLIKYYVRARLAKKLPGNIINISSIISQRGYAGLAVYSSSKAGLDGITRALAREIGGKGFRINSILPGYFASDMSNMLSEQQKQQIINRTPLKRLATMNDVIAVVEFLVSDTSSFITGQSLVVDGGLTC